MAPHARHRTTSDERGFVYVWFAVVITLLLAVSAFTVDILHGYTTAQQAQNAADAAALAGVVRMPVFAPDARDTAIEVGNANIQGATITPDNSGLLPNQLRVTVRKEIKTFFAKIIGIDTLTINRSSVAEYDPPVEMGSSKNTFGNCGVGCSDANGHYWASVSGELSAKHNGNAAMQRWCDDPIAAAAEPVFGQLNGLGTWTGARRIDNCQGGSNNTDFDGTGQFFVIDKRNSGPLTVDIFDPAWVNTGRDCFSSEFEAFVNSFGSSPPDGRFVHSLEGHADLCTGDNEPRWDIPNEVIVGNGTTDPVVDDLSVPGSPGVPSAIEIYQARVQFGAGGKGPWAVDTTFTLRDGNNDPTPHLLTDNPVLCSRTFEGWVDARFYYEASVLAGDSPVMPNWRRWVSMPCHPTAPGRYYLQVTTSANSEGQNNFALSAYTPSGSRTGGDPDVNLYARDWFAIFTNERQPGGTTAEFDLARVLPADSDRTLYLNFFDIADAGSDTVVQVLPAEEAWIDGTTPPVDFDVFPLCRYERPAGTENGPTPWRFDAPLWGVPGGDTDAPNCTIVGRRTTDPDDFNGQWVGVSVPIPRTYRCDVVDGCWLRIRITNGTEVLDTSTWAAKFPGGPVRIIR